MKKTNSLKYLTLAAVFTALTAIATMIRVPALANGGYIHFGDAVIYIAASCIPSIYACISAAVGGALADIISGAAVWAPATFIIKAAIAFVFTYKKEKFLCKKNIVAIGIASVITIGGYYIAEAILFGNWTAPLLSVWGNAVQAVGSAAVYTVLAIAMDKANIKKRFIL